MKAQGKWTGSWARNILIRNRGRFVFGYKYPCLLLFHVPAKRKIACIWFVRIEKIEYNLQHQLVDVVSYQPNRFRVHRRAHNHLRKVHCGSASSSEMVSRRYNLYSGTHLASSANVLLHISHSSPSPGQLSRSAQSHTVFVLPHTEVSQSDTEGLLREHGQNMSAALQ